MSELIFYQLDIKITATCLLGCQLFEFIQQYYPVYFLSYPSSTIK